MRYLLALLALSNAATLLWHRYHRVTECSDKRCIQRDREFLELLEQHRKLTKEANLLTRQNVLLAVQCRKHRARADYYARGVITEVENYLQREGGT